MRDRSCTFSIAVAIVGAVCATSASSNDDIYRKLDIERQHAVLIDSGRPSANGASFGVVINQWARPLELRASPQTGGSMDGQLASALAELDAELKRFGTTRESILSLNAFVRGDASRHRNRSQRAIAEYLDAGRTAGPDDRHPRIPLVVLEVSDFESRGAASSTQDVVLEVVILDPSTTTLQQRAYPAWDYAPTKHRGFMLQSVGEPEGARDNHARNAGQEALREALKGMGAVLSRIAATSGDIHELTVYFDGTKGVTERRLQPIVEEFLGGRAALVEHASPVVRYVEARALPTSIGRVAVVAAGSVTHYR